MARSRVRRLVFKMGYLLFFGCCRWRSLERDHLPLGEASFFSSFSKSPIDGAGCCVRGASLRKFESLRWNFYIKQWKSPLFFSPLFNCFGPGAASERRRRATPLSQSLSVTPLVSISFHKQSAQGHFSGFSVSQSFIVSGRGRKRWKKKNCSVFTWNARWRSWLRRFPRCVSFPLKFLPFFGFIYFIWFFFPCPLRNLRWFSRWASAVFEMLSMPLFFSYIYLIEWPAGSRFRGIWQEV